VSRFFGIVSVYRNPRPQRFALNYLDPYLAGRSCQRAVSRDQRGIQSFGESQISSIISREIVPHLPDAGEQNEMWIAGERKIEEVGESLGAPFRRDAGGAHVAAQNLGDFQVNEMRSMQRLVRGEDDAAHTPSCGRVEENLKNRGSVNNDQRPFLSARIAAAGAGCGRTG
jgi:hypothetical protein